MLDTEAAKPSQKPAEDDVKEDMYLPTDSMAFTTTDPQSMTSRRRGKSSQRSDNISSTFSQFNNTHTEMGNDCEELSFEESDPLVDRSCRNNNQSVLAGSEKGGKSFMTPSLKSERPESES